jgi:hypothetical protein
MRRAIICVALALAGCESKETNAPPELTGLSSIRVLARVRCAHPGCPRVLDVELSPWSWPAGPKSAEFNEQLNRAEWGPPVFTGEPTTRPVYCPDHLSDAKTVPNPGPK